MNDEDSDSAALIERRRQLKNDVFPFVVQLPNFLGEVDYKKKFYRVLRPGQVNWEFQDIKTKRPFKTYLVGEIADATHGTRLQVLGNKRTDDLGYPFKDGTKIKNIVVLRCPSGSSTYGSNAFNNQFVALQQIVAHVNEEDDNKEKPLNGSAATWVTSTVALSEMHHPTDLIIVTLPRKYDSPSNERSGKRSPQIAKRLPITEKEEYAPFTDVNSKGLSNTTSQTNVEIRERYDPALLVDFSTQDLAFTHDKLVQHDIRDIEGKLIPAWKIADGLRPGTVVGIMATLHVYNIPSKRMSGFRRFFQIDAEKIRVMSEAMLPPQPEAIEPRSTSLSTSTTDFDSYRVSKRRATLLAEQPSAKKNKNTIKKTQPQPVDEGDVKMIP